MASFTINPVPEMVSQRFRYLPAFVPIIDPTCGRYCLKALLKYWYEVGMGFRYQDIALPKPVSLIADWIGFDPFDDFPPAQYLLIESHDLPQTANAWIARLQQEGPIILGGYLGDATKVSHFILLVGASSDDPPTFFYKDPLAGDVLKSEAFATMQPRIELPIVSARRDILTNLATHLPNAITTLPHAT